MPDGLRALSRGLRKAGRDAGDEVRKIVERGALQVKNEWRDNAKRSAGAHAKRYPYSISYDVMRVGDYLTFASIGPDKDRPQGALGNLLEFGSTNNPPHNDGGRALRAEEPRFTAAIEALAGRLS